MTNFGEIDIETGYNLVISSADVSKKIKIRLKFNCCSLVVFYYTMENFKDLTGLLYQKCHRYNRVFCILIGFPVKNNIFCTNKIVLLYSKFMIPSLTKQYYT